MEFWVSSSTYPHPHRTRSASYLVYKLILFDPEHDLEMEPEVYLHQVEIFFHEVYAQTTYYLADIRTMPVVHAPDTSLNKLAGGICSPDAGRS